MKKQLAVLFYCVTGCILQNTYVQAQQSKINVFSIDQQVVAKNKNRIASNNSSILPAYKQLLKEAAIALHFAPVNVMEKTAIPPSGNKHDYMSLAPYYWPDSTKANGLPYIRKDGETNPEVKKYKDKENLPKLCENIYTLSLANYFSNDSRYASHAITLLNVWFLDTATKMNPNLNFGQAMKGHNDGRGAGLIDTRHLIKVIDGIGLLKQSGKLSQEKYQGLQNWFSQFLVWMQTSSNGKDEFNAKNNHGMWYDAQRLSFALFTGQTNLANAIITNAQKRLDEQMDNDGKFPAELARTNSLHYSLFVLEPLIKIAVMSKSLDRDLINYESISGKSIKKGFEAHYPYMANEKKWPGQQISQFDFEEAVPLLAFGEILFNCQRCGQVIKKIHPDKTENLRLKLITTNN